MKLSRRCTDENWGVAWLPSVGVVVWAWLPPVGKGVGLKPRTVVTMADQSEKSVSMALKESKEGSDWTLAEDEMWSDSSLTLDSDDPLPNISGPSSGCITDSLLTEVVGVAVELSSVPNTDLISMEDFLLKIVAGSGDNPVPNGVLSCCSNDP